LAGVGLAVGGFGHRSVSRRIDVGRNELVQEQNDEVLRRAMSYETHIVLSTKTFKQCESRGEEQRESPVIAASGRNLWPRGDRDRG